MARHDLMTVKEHLETIDKARDLAGRSARGRARSGQVTWTNPGGSFAWLEYIEHTFKGGVMALATWWRGDTVPTLSLVPGFRIEASRDTHLIADITRLAPDEVHQRMHTGHQPYLAFVEQAPVGYGWMATQDASIGELGLHFALPETERYLWDFATLPEWQGYGIYPRLLQRILTQQLPSVERVWIIHAPENSPSGVGMTKAGLLPIGQLSFRSDGGVGLAPFDSLERAQAGAALLGIPVIESVLAPCWSCGGATHTHSTVVDADTCWPTLRPTTQRCTCAIELKPAKTRAA